MMIIKPYKKQFEQQESGGNFHGTNKDFSRETSYYLRITSKFKVHHKKLKSERRRTIKKESEWIEVRRDK